MKSDFSTRKKLPRWPRRTAWALIWLVTLFALFTGIENWRGRRAWNAFAEECAQRGDRLDQAASIPPPVPPEENLAEAPIFASLFAEPQTEEAKAFLEINISPDGKRPPQASWHAGTPTDLAAWQAYYRARSDFPQPSQPGTPAEDVLLALSNFDRQLEEARAAAARPRTRFPLHYEQNTAMRLPHLQPLMRLSPLIRLRIAAELQAGHAEEAMADTALLLRLADALAEEPVLISYLVRLNILAQAMHGVREGLGQRAWNDAQLVEFQQIFGSLNLIAGLQTSLRGERNLYSLPAIDIMQQHPETVSNLGGADPWARGALALIPVGWFEQNKTVVGRLETETLASLNAAARHINKERFEATEEKVQREMSKRSPYTIFARMLLPSLTAAVQRAAAFQEMVQLAFAAVTLERHRLLHGDYPPSLDLIDAAARQTADAPWPADPASGHPLRYRYLPEGGFMLYYDGWNQVDDGGVSAFLNPYTDSPSATSGDLVWPTDHEQEAKTPLPRPEGR